MALIQLNTVTSGNEECEGSRYNNASFREKRNPGTTFSSFQGGIIHELYFENTNLIKRISCGVRVDVVRSEFLYEIENAGNVSDGHVLDLVLNESIHLDVPRQPLQPHLIPIPGQPHQHVTVIALSEARVDPQVSGGDFRRPARRERLPRLLEPLEPEIPEVRLQQLLQVIAELHVELSVKDRLHGEPLRPLRQNVQVRGEDVHRRLPEHPGRVVPRDDAHAQAQVTVTGEDVHGTADFQLGIVFVGRRRDDTGHEDEEERSDGHPSRHWHLVEWGDSVWCTEIVAMGRKVIDTSRNLSTIVCFDPKRLDY